jgi:hypothetical protein
LLGAKNLAVVRVGLPEYGKILRYAQNDSLFGRIGIRSHHLLADPHSFEWTPAARRYTLSAIQQSKEPLTMLAATTGTLRVAIPLWGSIVLTLAGVAYLVLGARWRQTFDVLSMTVLGCLAGLLSCGWAALSPPLAIILGGAILGCVTAFFGKVCHAILAAVSLATVLATGAALAAGPRGFTSYMVAGIAGGGDSVHVSGPNLACDPVLAAALIGLVGGALVAALRRELSYRLVTGAQGAALVVLGMAAIVAGLRGEERPPVTTAFPLTTDVVWFLMVVAGLLVQSALARKRAARQEASDASEESDLELESKR